MAEHEHDVLVIGSGAGGGMAAYVLTQAGVKVHMLEAGRDYDPVAETAMFSENRDAPLLGNGTPDKDFGYYNATIDGGWDIDGEPYSTGENTEFLWWRTRMLGGRTNHWARNSFRMGEYDFKPQSRDGLGFDWPLTYDDLAPWYDRVEKLVGVYGVNSGLANHPDSGDGVLQPPPKARVPELFAAAAAADIGIPCVPARRAVLTRDPGDGRSACFWATDCGRGCNIGAAFQTTTSLLPWARTTGNLTITTDAMVYEITTGDDGKANGARYIDKTTGEHKFIGARAVVLAASAASSARILLNSNVKDSGGLANSSGQIGRNLMDTVGSGITGQIPALENRPRYNEDGAMGMHVYIPFWLYEEQAAGQLDFPRGYHLEVYSQFSAPGMGSGSGLDGYGASILDSARRYYGSFIHFAQRGEMIPNSHCYAEIDPDGKDKFGIPILKFYYKHTDYEYDQVTHAQQASIEIIERMGGRVVSDVKTPQEAIAAGGEIIHEIGTARMGASAADSVTNSYGQTWDVPNLFILDGAIFASKAHKNPTLTILTLAMRGADHLVNEMKRGVL